MNYFQYRITVQGTQGPILNEYPGEQWSRVTEASEERGYDSKFERRLITDSAILPLLVDTTGYIQAGDMVICPWEILAEATFSGS